MSAPAASDAGVSGGSALSFLRHTSPHTAGTCSIAPEALVPPGVQALLDACSAVYPNQPNPLQVTTRLKYWLGGQDPLDYISMYWNPGNDEMRVPSHWHYISFGLSDLHGDGRVHPLPSASPVARTASPVAGTASPLGAAASPSGKGIELTFRLVASSPENAPLWPAAMMQALARYIHATGNCIQAGDHIGGVALGNLKLRHLLVARDPQLGNLTTSHGTVTFTQLVACTGRELAAAQRGDPHKVLAAMARHSNGCSPYLVSMCSRGSVTSPRDARVTSRDARATSRDARGPAALAAVTAPYILLTPQSMESVGASETAPAHAAPLTRTREAVSHSIEDAEDMRMATDSFEMSSIQRALPDIDAHVEGAGLAGAVSYLPGAHLVFSRQAAAMLPLAIDGRVRCGSHFTFSWSGRVGRHVTPVGRHVTLVGRDVTHALCSDAPRHLAMAQHWLQIYIPDQLAEDMSQKFARFSRLVESESSASETEDAACDASERDGDTTTYQCDKDGSPRVARTSERDERISLPCSFTWPEYQLTFSVVDELYPKDFIML